MSTRKDIDGKGFVDAGAVRRPGSAGERFTRVGSRPKQYVVRSLLESARGIGRGFCVRALVVRSHHYGEEEEGSGQEGRQEEEEVTLLPGVRFGLA